MDKWWQHRRVMLMNWAIALDTKIGELERSVQSWWTETFGTWPVSDQTTTGQPILERAIDPAERDRMELAHRFAAMMTRGRWR
jgi:hypothetical protein